MKKLLTYLCIAVIFSFFSAKALAFKIQYDDITEEYTGSIFDLRVNGNEVAMPIAPIIFNDRALVPVREIFEALGATVVYEEKTKCVNISYSETTVSVYINNPSAYVNGKKIDIPDGAVPKLINIVGTPAKTMVPVRFISESLKLNVGFQNNTIYISNDDLKYTPAETRPPVQTQPTETQPPSETVSGPSALTGVSFAPYENTAVVVTAAISGGAPRTNQFVLTNPTRLVVDLYDCALATTQLSTNVGVCGVSKIRLGFDDGRTRIVVDADNIAASAVYIENGAVVISVTTVGTPSSEIYFYNGATSAVSPNQAPPQAAQETGDITSIPTAQYDNAKKLIVIDPGHGGKDGGATGILNGNNIHEKDLTLSISKKVYDILTANGYAAAMTRSVDEYPTLTARSDFANQSNAACFVSIHINSVDSAPTAAGTEVYYSSINNGDEYGIKSSYLAKCIDNALVAALGSKDRGVKQANHVVTRTSLMPAALVEVGFISNNDELTLMCTDAYQQKAAEGISAGIIKALETITIPVDKTELTELRRTKLTEWENSQ